MRTIITAYITLFLLLVTADNSSAQTAAAELEKVSQSYLSTEHLSMEADVYVHSSKADKTGSLLGKGVMRKSRNNYYSRFLDDEMLTNSRCVVLIDHAQKVVEVYGAGKSRKESQANQIPDIKAMIAANDSVKYHGIKSGMKHFTFYNKYAPVTQTELYVNSSTGFIEKIEYYYAQDSEESFDAYKVVVQYRNINTQNPGESIFSEKKYIMRKGGNTVLAPSYKNYQLIAEDK